MLNCVMLKFLILLLNLINFIKTILKDVVTKIRKVKESLLFINHSTPFHNNHIKYDFLNRSELPTRILFHHLSLY